MAMAAVGERRVVCLDTPPRGRSERFAVAFDAGDEVENRRHSDNPFRKAHEPTREARALMHGAPGEWLAVRKPSSWRR
jgi:hypothetical protein